MRRKIAPLVVLTAALALAVLPATPAGAGKSFTFYGAGYGHGLGMSQWGSYGLAWAGWTHQQILRHFYSHTQVQVTQNPPRFLRVGLTQGRVRLTLTAGGGPVDLKVGDPKNGQLVGTIPNGDTWRVLVGGSHFRVLDAAGAEVGGRLWGGTANNLYATYGPNHARVHVPEGGHTYNRGYLEFNIYDCASRCVERLILQIAPEHYLYGISEVPSSWPMQALETQAVAARDYAFYQARYGQNRGVCNCALVDDASAQVFAGWDKEGGLMGDRWVAAVIGTAGQVITHQGSLIEAFYMASSGGYTENNENVWGGSPIPYLRGVCDPGDYTAANAARVWSTTMTDAEVTSRLGLGIGKVTGFSHFSRGVSGRILTVEVDGASGRVTISGATLRARLGLMDDRVWINRDRRVVGAIRTKYDDLNCRPGLPISPQLLVPGGARQAFVQGGIFRNDGTGVSVWLKGAVYDKYVQVGGAAGFLGLPLAAPKGLTAPAGCGQVLCTRTRFAGGTIYFKGPVGAHALHGPVLASYASLGGPGGSLGFPTSDVRFGSGGQFATFEHGTITCSNGTCSRS